MQGIHNGAPGIKAPNIDSIIMFSVTSLVSRLNAVRPAGRRKDADDMTKKLLASITPELSPSMSLDAQKEYRRSFALLLALALSKLVAIVTLQLQSKPSMSSGAANGKPVVLTSNQLVWTLVLTAHDENGTL